MPELPEVETVRRGLMPYVKNKRIIKVIVREMRLRLPVSVDLPEQLINQEVLDLARRGKYLLLHLNHGSLIVHLGMSGNIRIFNQDTPLKKHDHVDIILEDNTLLRFNDPRRFGVVVFSEAAHEHALIRHMGVEPLSDDFDASYLLTAAKGRHCPIKSLIMNGQIVVGVGNIYANEALFLAGTHPLQPSDTLTPTQAEKLVATVKEVLALAIDKGGTTLMNFINSHGRPGFFQQVLKVYGRAGKACRVCKTPLEEVRLSGRTTVFCKKCQK